MLYPGTSLDVGASSRQVRQAYMHVQTTGSECSSDDERSRALSVRLVGGGRKPEWTRLVDPVKRALYDNELGIDEETLTTEIREVNREFEQGVRWSLLLLAFFVLVASDNVTRLWGYALAPGFTETRHIAFGEFEAPNARGDVAYVSDHKYYSEFSSDTPFWQFVLHHRTWMLHLPTIALLAFLGTKGCNRFSVLVAKRIMQTRMNGEDDTSVRRLWLVLTTITICGLYVLLYFFGYDRIVPVKDVF